MTRRGTDVTTAERTWTITKTLLTFPPDPQAPGQIFGFLVEVTNNGPSTAHNVTVVDHTERPARSLTSKVGWTSADDCPADRRGPHLHTRRRAGQRGESKSFVIAAVTLPDQALGTYYEHGAA